MCTSAARLVGMSDTYIREAGAVAGDSRKYLQTVGYRFHLVVMRATEMVRICIVVVQHFSVMVPAKK